MPEERYSIMPSFVRSYTASPVSFPSRGQTCSLRHVVRQRAEKHHGRVRVRVFEPRHEQLPGKVYLPVKFRQDAGRIPHVDYSAAVRPDLAAAYFHPAAEAEDAAIIKSYHISLYLFLSANL